MNSLTVSDLHFTEGINDSYKWDLFDWMLDEAAKHEPDEFYILGDLFEKKDKHSSEIVNKLINGIIELSTFLPVTILKGNHDYLKPDHPFLKFLDHLNNVTFVTEPSEIGNNLWLPHTRTPEEDWKDIDFSNYEYVFMHQSLIGSVTSNFYELNHGISPKFFRNNPDTKFYSGDIHVPQVIDIKGTPQGLTYIGTPYPVAFGDHYEGRGLILKDEGDIEINMPTIAKWSIVINHPEELKKIDMREDDQVKIKLELESQEAADWPEYKKEIKQWCIDNKIHLKDLKFKVKDNLTRIQKAQGTTSKDTYKQEAPDVILKKFCEVEKLDDRIKQEGLELLA